MVDVGRVVLCMITSNNTVLKMDANAVAASSPKASFVATGTIRRSAYFQLDVCTQYRNSKAFDRIP